MQMVTVLPGQGGQFQSVFPLILTAQKLTFLRYLPETGPAMQEPNEVHLAL